MKRSIVFIEKLAINIVNKKKLLITKRKALVLVKILIVVFDIGGVIVDYTPRELK